MARSRGWYAFSNLISNATPQFAADACSYDWKDLCLLTWFGAKTWLEYAGSGDNDVAELLAVRRTVLELLLEFSEAEWLMADRLSIIVADRHPQLETTSGRATVLHVLLGPLAWIGVLEAGEDTSGRPHVRLTEGAHEGIRRCLGGKMRAAPVHASAEAVPSIAVQPTGEIVALDGSDVKLLLKLSAFTDPLAIDRASLFILTTQSLGAALDEGIDPTAIVKFLEEQGGRPLPAAVSQLFSDVGSATWRVGFAGYFVTAPSGEALDDLMAKHPPGWTLSRIAPDIASIELQGNAVDILRSLQRAGRRTTADTSLKREYPKQFSWKPVQSDNRFKELFTGLEKKREARQTALGHDEILQILDLAVEGRSTVSIDYKGRGKSNVQHAVLSLCDFTESRLCGYDPVSNHVVIPFGSILHIQLSKELDEVRDI
jgi:hypothetical protein